MELKAARSLLVWMVVCQVWTIIFKLDFWWFFTNILAVIITFSILYFAAANSGGPKV